MSDLCAHIRFRGSETMTKLMRAVLVLTMPSNYGYLLILPMYLFFPAFGSRLFFGLAQRFRLPGVAPSSAVGSDAPA